MIDHLDDLAAAGVTSFKIEGRNKKAFYAATVVHAYRSVLDGADPASVADDLRAISHRPYSTGFYYGMAQQSSELDGYLKECLHVATVQSRRFRCVISPGFLHPKRPRRVQCRLRWKWRIARLQLIPS